MSVWWSLVLIVPGAALGLWAWLDWSAARAVERMRADFKSAFPDDCFLCSFYDYGRRELGSSAEPPSHQCPEHWRRWRRRV